MILKMNNTEKFIELTIICMVGVILGITLHVFLMSNNCINKGKIHLAGKAYYCSEVYGGER